MLPELLLGVSVLSVASGSLVLTYLAGLSLKAAADVALIPFAIGLSGFVVHIGALYLGIWKIFRPGQRLLLVAVAMAVLLMLVWMAHILAVAVTNGELDWRTLLFQILRGVGLSWGAYECSRYSAMLRKRAYLGIGEPMVAHRIWLWGFASASTLLVVILNIAGTLLYGSTWSATPMGMLLLSLLSLIAAFAIALAFFPPDAYVRIVDERYARVSAVAGWRLLSSTSSPMRYTRRLP